MGESATSRPQKWPNSATERRGFGCGRSVGNGGYRRLLVSALPERRTRPTIRCLRDDLGLELPTVDVDLGTLDHPLLDEARRLAPAAPQGQKRILAIDHPLVYRLRHGRWRGATWLEEDASRFWLLAGAQRVAGSRDDAYEVFVGLHEAGRLLPDPDDRLRDAAERDARVIAAIRTGASRALGAAAAAPATDVAIRLAGLVDVRLHVSTAGDEVWVAIATRAVDGMFIAEGLRDLLFTIVLDAAGAEIWEPRSDWPSGSLEWFEVARLALREPAQ
jgi:hypothetical protein